MCHDVSCSLFFFLMLCFVCVCLWPQRVTYPCARGTCHVQAPEFKPEEPLGEHQVKGFPSFPSTVLRTMYTHESSGAISNSGFPISSFKHAYLMCFYNLHEVRHWDQIVYLAHSQHVIHVCTKLWHVCCTVVLPLSKSYSRTEHRAKMYNTRRHRNSNTSSHESLLLL